MSAPVLEIRDLKTYFPVEEGFIFKRKVAEVRAVDGVNLSLAEGEVLGLVGESGCGKSTLARTILQLIPPTSGTISLDGKDLTGGSMETLAEARRNLQMIFQDPYASLNPRMTIFDTLAEPLIVHRICAREEVPRRVASLMETVGLAGRLIHKYPHEFSGGQRQRIAIARALTMNPRVIVADEPVSALDVSIQAQILNLLSDLTKRMKLSIIFIAHDLSVVKHLSDRVAVMYLGKIVEIGAATDIIEHPCHPYTRALISAIPSVNPDLEKHRQRIVLGGDPPSPINPPSGCPFHPRCAFAIERCKTIVPPLDPFRDRRVACIRAEEIGTASPLGAP